MQLNQLYRRGIIIPLDSAAQSQMSAWNISTPIRVIFYSMTDEDVFDKLCEAGVFECLNEQLGTNIDDYEEDVVPFEKVSQMKKCVSDLQKQFSGKRQITDFLNELEYLVSDSIRLKMPIYFIL